MHASSASAPPAQGETELLLEELQLEQQLERLTCSQDPRRFIERHVTIWDDLNQPIPFRLWDFQVEALKAICEDRRVIVLKARQLGLSWLTLAYALWLCLFRQGSRVVMLCKNLEDAKEMLGRVRWMLERIEADPDSAFLLAGLSRDKDAADQIAVGESSLRALVAKSRAARQHNVALLILDEFAFADDAGGIWQAAMPTVRRGSIVCISTGNGATGQGEEFADQWSAASSGRSGFRHLFFPWHVEPTRDEKWLEQERRKFDTRPERFQVEYPESEQDAFRRANVELFFDLSGIDAAQRLGHEYDAMRREDKLPPPIGDAWQVGIDWGEHTHVVFLWPLEAGGFYVFDELVAENDEPSRIAGEVGTRAARLPFELDEARYDTAGKSSMNTFMAYSDRDLNRFGVAFNVRKGGAALYLRMLMRRAKEDKRTRVLAISERCPVLVHQLRAVEAEIEAKGAVDPHVKKAPQQHGLDALIAGVSPVARRHLQA